MVDQHHVYALIAKAICDTRKDNPEHQIDPEEAKQIAKCVVEALADPFEISPVVERSE
jgi:hypothetical protein